MSNKRIPGIVVSGLKGGGGKTILSLSLAASLRTRGLKVIPFKKGPDYIDAGWLSKASGSTCYNLDLFMMTPEQVLGSFIDHSAGSEFAIIEGNRGLYDGMDHLGSYSTAELAKLLSLPVILVVDCSKVSNTVAAMVMGCQQMDPEVPIAGVVLNRVATKRQESVIRNAIKERCNIPVLGVIPRLRKDPFPERHMGLVPSQEHDKIRESLDVVREIGEMYLDLDQIVDIANKTGKEVRQEEAKAEKDEGNRVDSGPRIGVLRDSAFQFYYEENFEALRDRGAEIVEISPLDDDELPEIDSLYIGGGFPETHAAELSENKKFRNSVNDAIQGGLPVYAECGGLMYLGKSLTLKDRIYPMVGALPVTFGLAKRPSAHGYAVVEVERENPYFPGGTVIKGHEFHYSTVLDVDDSEVYMAFKVNRGKGIIDNKDGMCYKNVLAAYTHVHAIGSPEWADGMVRSAIKYKKGTKE